MRTEGRVRWPRLSASSGNLSKHQAPASRSQKGSKHQTPKIFRLAKAIRSSAGVPHLGPGAWRLSGVGSLVFGIYLFTCSSSAQEALNISLAGEHAARVRRLSREGQPYTIKYGGAEVRLSSRVAGEWNDNVTLLEKDEVSDFIFRPQATADLAWPITPANAFEASVTAGYAKYASHDEFDRPFVLPGSAIAFDIFVGDVRLTIEDRFSYYQDPAESAVVTGTAEFGGLENLAGLRALADWHDAELSVSYHHLLFVSTTREFEHLDRSSHQFFSRFTLNPAPFLQAGTEGGLTPTEYSDSFLRDNLSYSAGGFAEATITPHLSAHGRGGAVFFHYDDTAGRPGSGIFTRTENEEDVSNFYFGFGLTHRIRKSLTLSLDLGQESELGVNQDLAETFYVRPRVEWLVSQGISVSGSISYEDGTESGLHQSEHFSRISTGISGTWRWSKHWNAGLSWQFITRDSDQPLRSYDNHRVLLEISYFP